MKYSNTYRNAFESGSSVCSANLSACCNGQLYTLEQNDTAYWAYDILQAKGPNLTSSPVVVAVKSGGQEILIRIESLFNDSVVSGQGISVTTHAQNILIGPIDESTYELVVPDAGTYPDIEGTSWDFSIYANNLARQTVSLNN